MSYYNSYYDQPYYNNFFNGMGLIFGTLIASNVLTRCPIFINKFTELYIIGLSGSFYYTVYLAYNNKYRNRFRDDFKNSFFITMCGSLVYHHFNYNS